MIRIITVDREYGAGGNATASFLRGLSTALPPMLQIMKDIGGVEMPEFIGKLVPDEPEGAPKADPKKN